LGHMTARQISLLVLSGALIVGCFVWGLCLRNPAPRVQLPKGVSLRTVLAEGNLHVPKGWHTIRKRTLTLAQSLSWRNVRYRLNNMLGRGYNPVLNPPKAVWLPYNLSECSELSGDIYLLAKELLPDGYDDHWPEQLDLGYTYGGTNRVRRARDWIAANEAGIVENGVVAEREKVPRPTGIGEALSEPYRTNLCAVIRDSKGIVKIVPLNCLRAYRDGGLIRLPKEQ